MVIVYSPKRKNDDRKKCHFLRCTPSIYFLWPITLTGDLTMVLWVDCLTYSSNSVCNPMFNHLEFIKSLMATFAVCEWMGIIGVELVFSLCCPCMMYMMDHQCLDLRVLMYYGDSAYSWGIKVVVVYHTNNACIAHYRYISLWFVSLKIFYNCRRKEKGWFDNGRHRYPAMMCVKEVLQLYKC